MASIRILSGGAPKAVFLKLTPQFEQKSGHKIELVFAVTSVLRDKIAAGDNADALVLPTNILDAYQSEGVVRREGRAVLGLVSISAVVRTGARKPDLSTKDKVRQALLDAGSLIFSTPGATPSGTHMGKLVNQFGIGDAIAKKTIHRPALEGGVQLMAGGQAVLGFYPKSEVIDTNGIDLAGPLPPDIQLTTIYGAAVTAKSTAPDAAAAFIAFMRAPANRAAWAKAGFDPPPA